MPVIHPFLLALIPILHIVASNPGQASVADALIPALVSLCFTVIAFVGMRLVLKDPEAAGLVVSIFLALFFGTGHFVDFTLRHLSGMSPWYLVIAAALVTAAAVALLVARYRDRLPGASVKTYTVLALLAAGGLVLLLMLASLAIAFPAYFLVVALCAILAAGVFFAARYRGRLKNLTRVLNVVAVTLLALVVVNLLTGTPRRDVSIRADEVRSAARGGRAEPLHRSLICPLPQRGPGRAGRTGRPLLPSGHLLHNPRRIRQRELPARQLLLRQQRVRRLAGGPGLSCGGGQPQQLQPH